MRALLVVMGLLGLVAPALADTPPPPKKHVPGAVVFVLDRSGSMQGGRLDAMKQATLDAIAVLDPKDEVGIVVFDSEATVWVPLQVAANKVAITKKVGTLQSGGGTNYLPGLQHANVLLAGSKLAKKHVVFLSDGEAPYDGVIDQVKSMAKAKVTVSTIALPGGDTKLLSDIATEGQGRVYDVTDLKKLSTAFVTEMKTALP